MGGLERLKRGDTHVWKTGDEGLDEKYVPAWELPVKERRHVQRYCGAN